MIKATRSDRKIFFYIAHDSDGDDNDDGDNKLMAMLLGLWWWMDWVWWSCEDGAKLMGVGYDVFRDCAPRFDPK